MPDYYRSLTALHEAWEGCTRCALSERRESFPFCHMVHGSGPTGGVMVIGEGPGKTEEEEGSPFVGKSGQLLRIQLENFGLLDDCYMTNIVLCRSCKPLEINGEVVKLRGEITMEDTPPRYPHIEACRPRLMNEIYLVDPIIILAVGRSAAEALAGGNVKIVKETGSIRTVGVPGVTKEACLTEKRRVWRRKVKGKMVAPVRPYMVRYPLMPIVHPSFVLRDLENTALNSPMHRFTDAINTLKRILDMRKELYGER